MAEQRTPAAPGAYGAFGALGTLRHRSRTFWPIMLAGAAGMAALAGAGCQATADRGGGSTRGQATKEERYQAARARARALEPDPPRTSGITLRSASAINPGMSERELEQASQSDPMAAYRSLLDPN